ncbi:hypothetical protein [Bacillus pinisoli]|uniref:hypothetical protein n=1 Tax=Bacillus pinisoli TaxID=2901866 RepID=UPI001FF2174E|nr:hypothetical protein [Bacillus pinisoli]
MDVTKIGGGIQVNKIVSMDLIEQAFDEVLSAIEHMEETVESHTEIEINQVKIVQQEKVEFIQSQLSKVEAIMSKKERVRPSFKFALGR